MRAAEIQDDLAQILVTEEEIHAKLDELAQRVAADYAGKDLLSALSCRSPGALILALCLSTIERRR